MSRSVSKARDNNATAIKINANETLLKKYDVVALLCGRWMWWQLVENGQTQEHWYAHRGGRCTCIYNSAETPLARKATRSFLEAAIVVSVSSEEEIWNYIILF